MSAVEKEEMKTIKIAASTHARLSILAAAFGKTMSEVIDYVLETAYPEILEETDQILDRMASFPKMAEASQKKTRPKDE